jgi:hypothetical protein
LGNREQEPIPSPVTKGSDIATSENPGSAVEKNLRSAQITKILQKLPRDERYPEEAIRLMKLKYKIAMKDDPSTDEIREWHHGIRRDMADAGFLWNPPD